MNNVTEICQAILDQLEYKLTTEGERIRQEFMVRAKELIQREVKRGVKALTVSQWQDAEDGKIVIQFKFEMPEEWKKPNEKPEIPF